MKKPIIGLNGPPHSGKTYVLNYLHTLLPHATKISIQDGMFNLMQESDVHEARAYTSYAEYKASDSFNRLCVIDFAQHMRTTCGERVFVNACMETEAYESAKVVLFDNIGLPADHRWATEVGEPYLLLRLDTALWSGEPHKALKRRLNGPWEGDSRSPFYHDKMLTAYDSVQMCLLLDLIADPNPERNRGPYHEYHSLWHRHFATSE